MTFFLHGLKTRRWSDGTSHSEHGRELSGALDVHLGLLGWSCACVKFIRTCWDRECYGLFFVLQLSL